MQHNGQVGSVSHNHVAEDDGTAERARRRRCGERRRCGCASDERSGRALLLLLLWQLACKVAEALDARHEGLCQCRLAQHVLHEATEREAIDEGKGKGAVGDGTFEASGGEGERDDHR